MYRLVINYMLSGNLVVTVLDRWILRCGRRAVVLVPHRAPALRPVTGVGRRREPVHRPHRSGVWLTCRVCVSAARTPAALGLTIGIAMSILKKWEVPFTCLSEDFENV